MQEDCKSKWRSVLVATLASTLVAAAGCADSVTDCVDADGGVGAAVTTNFNATCHPVARLDINGHVLDAHEATIAVFEGEYYLYGTSFGCGFVWQKPGTPFCGFRSYRSRDMNHWQDNGPLFDAHGELWQTRCGCTSTRCGCFRPHVVFNEVTGRYVLWFNGNDVPSSYHVMTSPTPNGPFQEVEEPVMAINSYGPITIPNNGDPSVFVDDDGTGYLSYTDWRKGGDIIIERLNATFTSGTGEYIRLGVKRVEAPAMFKRAGRYHLLYSDPNCGLCGGTGTSWRSSSAPLGQWSGGIKVSEDSCGGQPSHVTRIVDKSGIETFVYQSDLWDPDGDGDQRKANNYWGPLEFDGETLRPIRCQRKFTVPQLSGNDATRPHP